jgi:hypothetical protein
MQTRHHPLRGSPLGTCREIVSFHYGPPDRGRKAYLQASLHADELPGMLVAHHLRQRLQALEAAGRLLGEIVVVPVANPIGLAQSVLRSPQGRFDLHSGENFNRHYPALTSPVLAAVEGRLGGDAQANARLVRAALREALQAQPEDTELASLRKTLLGLACDAEVVLDLHCDAESLTHLYTGTPLWPQVEPLARLIGAQATLLALESGDNPFDEACSQTWWQLRDRLQGRHPVPLGCISVTVELRGTADVSHAQASGDAGALLDYLAHLGLVDAPVELPPLLQPATPLEATEVLHAPASGVVVHLRALGESIRCGDAVFEVIDPIDAGVHAVHSRTDGLLLSRDTVRYALAGRPLCKVVGTVPIRSGKLSSD